MVHNGIEYGLMAAYAEGLNVLAHADAGLQQAGADAETAPLSNPRFFQYQLNVAAIAEVWRHGSIIASRLLDLTAAALAKDGKLAGFAGHVADSGEGRWTVEAAIEVGVPAHGAERGAFWRFESRGRAELCQQGAVGDAPGVRRPRREVFLNNARYGGAIAHGTSRLRCASCCLARPGTCATARSFRRSTTWCAADLLTVPVIGVARQGCDVELAGRSACARA